MMLILAYRACRSQGSFDSVTPLSSILLPIHDNEAEEFLDQTNQSYEYECTRSLEVLIYLFFLFL